MNQLRKENKPQSFFYRCINLCLSVIASMTIASAQNGEKPVSPKWWISSGVEGGMILNLNSYSYEISGIPVGSKGWGNSKKTNISGSYSIFLY